MAKVVLVWNEHPTEVVAGFHARKVARILREKYGHTVVLKKTPAKETNYGIVSRLKPNDAVDALRHIVTLSSEEKARSAGLRHKALAFNFHCSPDFKFKQAQERRADEFRISTIQHTYADDPNETALGATGTAELLFLEDADRQAWTIEMPGYYEELKINTSKRQRKRGDAVWSAVQQKRVGLIERDRIEHTLVRSYHEFRTPLKHENQKKYIDAAVSEKIAREIHEKISKQKFVRKPFYDF